MLPDLSLLVHRSRSPPPSHPYHSRPHLGFEREIHMAQTVLDHAQTRFASLGQEVPDPHPWIIPKTPRPLLLRVGQRPGTQD